LFLGCSEIETEHKQTISDMIIDTTKMSSRGQVVIPLDMREGIKEGDKLIVIRKDNEIILKKSIPESALWSEKSLAKTWLNKEEDRIWKDL
jgi:AbrB family looped-hinge helix DNA binding protein